MSHISIRRKPRQGDSLLLVTATGMPRYRAATSFYFLPL